NLARQGDMRAEGLEIRTKARSRCFVLEPRRERRRACRIRLARFTHGLRSLGLPGAKRAQDLRSRPVRQAIEAHQQRLPSRGECVRDPARYPVKLRTATLRPTAGDPKGHVQARHRYRTAAAGSDALAGRRVKRIALLLIGPQREEQPPRRFARRGGWGLLPRPRARLSAAAQTASGGGGPSSPTGRPSRRMSRSACCTEWLRTNARSPAKSFSSAMMSIARA